MTEMFGLVLSGGESKRMGTDKGRLIYPKISSLEQRMHAAQLLESCGLQTFISCRPEQRFELPAKKIIVDHDDYKNTGPAAGLISAHFRHPEKAWLILACDFPWVVAEDVRHLLSYRCPSGLSVAYKNAEGFVEPLFALWEAATLNQFLKEPFKERISPSAILKSQNALTIAPLDSLRMKNINTFAEATPLLAPG